MQTMITTAATHKDPGDDQKTGAIIDAARAIFLARGFDAASMDQIALTANVSKRTVYNRFRSKEELFGAAIECTCRSLVPVNIDEIEDALPPRELIMELSRQFLKGVMSSEALSLRRIAAFEAGRAPSIGRCYLEHGPEWMVNHCAPILDRIIAKGALEIHDTKDALWRLGALITEPLYTQALLGAIPENLDDAIERQVKGGVDAFFKIYGTD